MRCLLYFGEGPPIAASPDATRGGVSPREAGTRLRRLHPPAIPSGSSDRRQGKGVRPPGRTVTESFIMPFGCMNYLFGGTRPRHYRTVAPSYRYSKCSACRFSARSAVM
jgi:hypothetical protein